MDGPAVSAIGSARSAPRQEGFERASALLLVTLWFALVTGLLESAILIFRRFVLIMCPVEGSLCIVRLGGGLVWWSLDALWLAPVAYIILFALPGLALFAGAAIAPRRLTIRVHVFALAFLTFFCLMLPFPQIHRIAALILALGLAAQASRIVGKRARGFARLVKHTLPALLTLVGLTALAVQGWPRWREWRQVAALPEQSARAPNILLIILDTVRASSLSLYGHERPTTPELERISGESVVFEWPIATSSWTLPSHGTIFTGRYPHELSTGFLTPLDGTYPTVAELLRAEGYLTAGFVANLHFASAETGLARGFIHYEDYLGWRENVLAHARLGQAPIIRDIRQSDSLREVWETLREFDWQAPRKRQGHRKTVEDINRDFLTWLDRSDKRPFFAFLNYYDAHLPYEPPPPFRQRFSEQDEDYGLYLGAIAYLDHHVGRLLQELERRGALDETVVIITSDHGEQFGEHGLVEHGNSLYLQLLHVPLLVRLPRGSSAGVRVEQPVSLRDLPITLLELAGVEAGGRLPGQSLSHFWQLADTSCLDPDVLLLAEHSPHIDRPRKGLDREGEWKSLLGTDFHYIRRWEGVEELFEYRSDPVEEHNLAGLPATREALDQLRGHLDRMIAGDPDAVAAGPQPSGAVCVSLQSWLRGDASLSSEVWLPRNGSCFRH